MLWLANNIVHKPWWSNNRVLFMTMSSAHECQLPKNIFAILKPFFNSICVLLFSLFSILFFPFMWSLFFASLFLFFLLFRFGWSSLIRYSSISLSCVSFSILISIMYQLWSYSLHCFVERCSVYFLFLPYNVCFVYVLSTWPLLNQFTNLLLHCIPILCHSSLYMWIHPPFQHFLTLKISGFVLFFLFFPFSVSLFWIDYVKALLLIKNHSWNNFNFLFL